MKDSHATLTKSEQNHWKSIMFTRFLCCESPVLQTLINLGKNSFCASAELQCANHYKTCHLWRISTPTCQRRTQNQWKRIMFTRFLRCTSPFSFFLQNPLKSLVKLHHLRMRFRPKHIHRESLNPYEKLLQIERSPCQFPQKYPNYTKTYRKPC